MLHPTRKRWIKLWTQESLYGSISKELEPAERWAWIGLLLLAGDSIEPGVVCAAPGIPWTDEQIATILVLPFETWQSAKAKMLEHKKIEVNHNGLRILNWDKYQGFNRTEYIRQYMRDYRVKQNVKQGNIKLTRDFASEEEGRGGEEEEDITTTASCLERAILNILKSITDYPFNYEKDLNYIRQLAVDFPQADLLEKAKKWATNKLDKPLKIKSNPHLQFRNWVEDKQGYDRKGGQGGTHRTNTRQLKPREEYKTPEEHRAAGRSNGS